VRLTVSVRIAVTWTASVSAPIASVKSAVMRPSATSSKPVFSALRKPVSSAATEYVPTGRLATVYAPLSAVTSVRVRPVLTFFTVTVTPGSTPADASRIVPAIWPLLCAAAAEAVAQTARSASRTIRR